MAASQSASSILSYISALISLLTLISIFALILDINAFAAIVSRPISTYAVAVMYKGYAPVVTAMLFAASSPYLSTITESISIFETMLEPSPMAVPAIPNNMYTRIESLYLNAYPYIHLHSRKASEREPSLIFFIIFFIIVTTCSYIKSHR